jgi:8-oxo-dGTP pyrophosphatase MutT (NUDIX family)
MSEDDRVRAPHHGEELNKGPVTPAREAASVIVLRDGDDGPEVLLVQRNPEQRFMGGAWVFPGGAVHEADGGPAEAGRRELDEEAGLPLPDTSGFVAFSRWITPEEAKIRFDTYFYVTEAPAGVEPRCARPTRLPPTATGTSASSSPPSSTSSSWPSSTRSSTPWRARGRAPCSP